MGRPFGITTTQIPGIPGRNYSKTNGQISKKPEIVLAAEEKPEKVNPDAWSGVSISVSKGIDDRFAIPEGQ